jgi:hypothetical protein
MHDINLLRINLLESFESLLNSLDYFCTAVRHETVLPAWVSCTEQEHHEKLGMRSKAVQFYHALWYEEGQDGRETLTCPGIVGASSETMEKALACNKAKDDFKEAVLALKYLSKSNASVLMADLHKRNETVAIAMKHMGAARLNLKQAYRHIPLLTKRPLKIGFTWSRQGRVIQRTSVNEARRLLERRRETPQLLTELQRLSEIPETEILARVRSICPHLRANVVFENEVKGGFERRLIQAPLPVLVPLRPGEPLPEFVPIAPEPLENPRLQRSDVRIEEQLFLPSIRVHRYREHYR